MLPSTDAPAAGRIDAIVVPTVRPAAYLRRIIPLARKLGCPLVTISSGQWTDKRRVRREASEGGATPSELLAIDLPGPSSVRLPQLRTSAVLPPLFRRRADTAIKRNLALALSRMMRWDHVAFLDDDIEVGAPDDLFRAAELLGRYNAVGLDIRGMPDNSVVCHANRAVGGAQECFVGGGALVIDAARTTSFFPDIYNEDWFFLLAPAGLRPVTMIGHAVQEPYDPYRTPERARQEELGDVLAEGVFWLLDENGDLSGADERYWRQFLGKRARFINDILARVPGIDVPPGEKQRMTAALKAARGRLFRITPELCVDYLRAWREDQEIWQDFMAGLDTAPQVRSPMDAVRRLSAPHGPKLTALHLRP
ncbi:hypothetical protein HII36_38110 [Nonomuraea sp. NN258]|uniref:hypothetical protein n=1 Tax=Nonomuraea antri TaxID=2730852 RepID=UPI001569B5B0|nr:hypothetical protein [Nonomuraea antri]NRQ37605.1 hypothetical protein [Nonomuraea antri]